MTLALQAHSSVADRVQEGIKTRLARHTEQRQNKAAACPARGSGFKRPCLVTLKGHLCCRTTRGQKRKLDDVHEDDDEHAGFDAAQLREHEEFTKVKNVAKIELGRYEMETWYFSPLPDEFKGCTVSSCAALASTALTELLRHSYHNCKG